MSYKEIPMKEALNRYAEGERVFYRYFTNGGYSWIGLVSLDHLRRNPERYKFFVEEPKKTLWDKQYPFETGFQDLKLFSSVDVKEALKELLSNWKDDSTQNYLYKNVREIFGKELINERI